MDSYSIHVNASPEHAFAPIRRIGGENGWYGYDWLWNLRGFMDLLVGGVGLRRGRRHPDQAQLGDPIDFFRVHDYKPNKRLRLLAEMKLPARAWLTFDVEPAKNGSLIRQTIEYDPIGLSGIVYWLLVYPFHFLIFKKMLRNIANLAQTQRV